MARSIEARFGANTYAQLGQCIQCGKPYDKTESWHTAYTKAGVVIVWYLTCDECMGKEAR